MLRIRNTQNLFACREFQGAPPLNGQQATYLVLDGQQRLTSLYQAFYGVGEHRYFLNLRRLLEGDDFEECALHLRAGSRRAKAYGEFEAQARDLVVPLSVLKGGAGEFGRWTRHVARLSASDEERVKLEDALSEIEENWIRTIDDYKFPVVTLSDATNAEAVCTIFETLNRQAEPIRAPDGTLLAPEREPPTVVGKDSVRLSNNRGFPSRPLLHAPDHLASLAQYAIL